MERTMGSGTRLAGAVMAAVLWSGTAVAAEPPRWAAAAERVIAEIDRAESAARAGQAEAAEEAAIASYFEQYEAGGMEIAARRTLGIARVGEVEALFAELQKRAAEKRGLGETAAALRTALRADARRLDAEKVVVEGGGQ
ncbi:hypothetical protein [Phaeospirillum tilakii]|uniref:Heavy-metal resistance n=1 Tax=Phaeospirillum tilakii TaxID=741673 RepID=A0ABW5CCM0_9PROT